MGGFSWRSVEKKFKSRAEKWARYTPTGYVVGRIEDAASKKRKKQREQAAKADDDIAASRDYQEQMLSVAQEQRAAEQTHLDEERARYDEIYSPIERRLASELNEGPATAEQAAIAGSDFASSFDASVDSRNRADMRLGVRPGSSAMRMRDENDVYNRARGISEAKTNARRVEDDQHFLRSQAFFQNNGSGIRSRLLQGMRSMYGSEYNALGNVANQRLGTGNYHQGLSDQYGVESKAGWNAALNIGSRVVTAAATGGKSEAARGIPTANSPVAQYEYQSPGAQGNGVTTFATTPNRNNYLNDGSTPVTGQARAAARGGVRSDINRY